MFAVPFVFFAVLCAAAANFVGAIIPFVVKHAVRRGWVDVPEGRKDHDRPIPPLGGLIIIPAYMVLLPTIGFSVFDHWALYLALLGIIAVGAYDDRRDLNSGIKFACQVLIASVVTLGGAALLPHLGHLFGGDHLVDLKFLSLPFTAVCVLFLINAMNMIDGVDGLAGGISFVMLGWLAIAALLAGNWPYASAAILMMALLFGFLLHNMRYPGHKRATVFLGDAGSMALGLIIAWLGIHVATDASAGLPPIGMAFIILLPIMDAFALFIVRKRAGRGAFQAGRDHLHHQLIDAGFTPGQTSFLLMVLVFVLGAFGVMGPRLFGITEGVMTWIWIGLLLSYTAFLLYRRKFIYKNMSE